MTTPTQYDPGRLRYVSEICLGTTLLWFLSRYLGDTDHVWAIISFIVVTVPTTEKAHPNFLSRITNTIVGCIMGIAFVVVFGSPEWLLPISLTGTALIASLLVRGSSNWKLTTATAALIVSSAIIGDRFGASPSTNRRGRVREYYGGAHLLAFLHLSPKDCKPSSKRQGVRHADYLAGAIRS